MNKEIKKKLKRILTKGIAAWGAILIIGGIVIAGCNIQSLVYLFSDPKDIFEVIDGPDPINTAVTIDVDAVVGNYATLENKTNGITTSKKYYYVAWLDNEKYIGIKVSSSNKELMEELTDGTYDYFMGDASWFPDKVQFKGILKSANSELTGYYKDFMSTAGYSNTEINNVCYFYYIDTDCVSVTGTILGFLGIILSILGLVLVIGNKAFGRISSKYNKMIKDGNGIAEYALDSDVKTGTEYSHLIIGSRVVFIGKATLGIEKGEDLVWAYLHNAGNQNKVITSVIIYTADAKQYAINCLGQEEVHAILSELTTKFPQIEIGPNDSFSQLYKKNKKEFKEYFQNRQRVVAGFGMQDNQF